MLRSEFASAFGTLTESFGKKTSDALASAYFEALQHCEIMDFEYAITRVLQDDPHFPKVPRILEFVMLRERQGRPLNIGDNKTFSFHCSCGDRFTVIKEVHLGFSQNGKVIPCDCGTQWSVEEMRMRMNDAIINGTFYADLP
jgi:hypothetical protein